MPKKRKTAAKSLGKLKIYADENIETIFNCIFKSEAKVNIISAVELGYKGRDDEFHFKEAKRKNRFLLTCDHDFLNHNKFKFNQMIGVVILDVPKEPPSWGWMSLWLTTHIVPSGKELNGTKILLHALTLDLFYMDETNKVKKETFNLIK